MSLEEKPEGTRGLLSWNLKLRSPNLISQGEASSVPGGLIGRTDLKEHTWIPLAPFLPLFLTKSARGPPEYHHPGRLNLASEGPLCQEDQKHHSAPSPFIRAAKLSFFRGAPGRPGTPSRPRRGIASPVAIRRGEGAQRKRCRDPRCSPRGSVFFHRLTRE